MTTGRVFRRAAAADPPVAVEAYGCTIRDADGREYLDAAGGAIVVNVGHGRREVADAMAAQAGRLAYAHGSVFTTEPLEAYARAVGRHLPLDGPAIYPVSGGSEAIETALKLARAYHLARGETERWIVFSRWGSYHGNTLGALDLSGRKPLRRPYEGWLGPLPARLGGLPVPRRAGRAPTRSGTADELAAELDRAFEAAGPGTVAAFVAEPIVGATLAAAVPPDGYWPAIAEVCRRHGVLLIADEVMTGFGRTGRWFGLDHWGVRPDLLVAAKGATSGYWPFGFVAASDEIHATVTGGRRVRPRVHLLARRRSRAAVAGEVLRILETEHLVEASAAKGERLLAGLRAPARRPSRTSARSAAAACWSASSWSPTAPRASRSRGRRGSPRRSCARRATAACSSTRAPATPTASTATRSCSGPPFIDHRRRARPDRRVARRGDRRGRGRRLRSASSAAGLGRRRRTGCRSPARGAVRGRGRRRRASPAARAPGARCRPGPRPGRPRTRRANDCGREPDREPATVASDPDDQRLEQQRCRPSPGRAGSGCRGVSCAARARPAPDAERLDQDRRDEQRPADRDDDDPDDHDHGQHAEQAADEDAARGSGRARPGLDVRRGLQRRATATRPPPSRARARRSA